MSEHSVAVVVICYNSARSITRLLDSLPAALAGVASEVVVVDNGSLDETAVVVAARDDVQLVRESNRGYSAGLNAGLRSTTGMHTYVLVLNPDLIMHPGSVARMAAAFDGPQVGIVAPAVLDEGGRLTRSLRREPSLGRASGLAFTGLPVFSEYVAEDEAYTRRHAVDWALGAVLLFRRDVFDQLGGWDESFFLYSEETDFCLRARDHGWTTVFEPTALATHEGGGSGTSPRIHAIQIINRVRLYRRRHGPVGGALYYGLTVLSELTWLARGHPQSRTSVSMLLRPGTRPAELGLDPTRLVPQ